jgi:hypothetical protein
MYRTSDWSDMAILPFYKVNRRNPSTINDDNDDDDDDDDELH